MHAKKVKKTEFIDGIVRHQPKKRAGARSSLDAFSASKLPVPEIGLNVSQAAGFQSAGESAGAIKDGLKFDLDLEDSPTKEKKRRFGRKRGDKTKATGKKRWLKRSAAVIVLLLMLVGGWVGWKFYRNTAKLTHNNNPFNLLGALQSAPLKNTDGRTNILLAGNSTDDPGHDGANLTDSIMLLSIDNTHHNAFMLSIPRDLWVSYQTKGCSVGYQGKINATYVCGEETKFKADGYANGGMGLLEKVVSENFGVPIHYYALINYGAFRDAVNAVGGITVTIKSKDPRGLYDPNISKPEGGPLKLANGDVTLNGQTALNLARARGDSAYSYGFPGSDFDRTMHQRQMLLAIKQKALSAGVLANPLKLGQLFDTLGKNVKTDVQLKEAQSFYAATKDLNDGSIQSVGLNDWNGKNLLMSYAAPNGSSALAPAGGVGNFTAIQAALKQIMSSDPVAQESAGVVVLNGSGVVGLAAKESTALTAKGMSIDSMANSAKQYDATMLIDNSKGKKPNTLKALQARYSVSPTTDAAISANYPSADFVVILGKNASVPQQ